MISIKDLKKGNYVLHDGQLAVVEEILKSNIEVRYVEIGGTAFCDMERVEAIPITEEWLLRLGLKISDQKLANIMTGSHYDKLYQKFGFYVGLKDGLIRYYYDPENWGPLDVSYVHHLQNSFYIATEIELKGLPVT